MKILLSLIVAIMGVSGFVFIDQQVEQKNTETIAQAELAIQNLEKQIAQLTAVGADSVTLFGGQLYYLHGGGISSSASSIKLTSLTIPQNDYKIQDSELSSTFYITVEPGSRTRQEFISCTTVTQNSDDTATLSGCTRGLAPITPYTASSSLQFGHSGGSRVIFSDPPQVYNQAVFKDNDETISGLFTYSSSNVPKLDYNPTSAGWTGLASTTFATIGRLADVALSSAVAATQLVVGYVELATSAEVASSTSLGNTGSNLVVAASSASSSPTIGCDDTATAGSRCVVVASTTGKIAQTYLPFSELWAFLGGVTSSGPVTFNTATTTFNATTSFNGVNYGVGEFADFYASTTITGSTLPQPVFLATSTNSLYLSDANVATSTDFLGFAVRNGVSTTTYKVATQLSGVVSGFTGLTAGARYYVQDAEGTIGTTAGTNEIFVGQAISATQIYLSRNSNGVWQYVGSATCATSSGSCDTTSNLLARFAVVKTVSNASNACDGPREGTTYNTMIVAKIGLTANSQKITPACDTAFGNVGYVQTDVTFTSTSSIRFSVSSSNTLSSQTQTAYFYR